MGQAPMSSPVILFINNKKRSLITTATFENIFGDREYILIILRRMSNNYMKNIDNENIGMKELADYGNY